MVCNARTISGSDALAYFHLSRIQSDQNMAQSNNTTWDESTLIVRSIVHHGNLRQAFKRALLLKGFGAMRTKQI